MNVNSDSGMLNTVSGKEGQSVQVEPESVFMISRDMHIKRLHRTLLDEHSRIKGRTTWYESVEQTDLDSYWDIITLSCHIRVG